MADRIERDELVRQVTERVGRDAAMVGEIVDATFEEIYETLKRGQGVTVRNFGNFYIREERGSWVFRFNPSQRLRALFGWSSTYRGPR